MYLIIKYDWEGFELYHPFNNATDAVTKLASIKEHVSKICAKADKINGDYHNDDSENDDLHSPWTNLLLEKKIEYAEYKIGNDERPEDYCIQKWNPKDEYWKCNCAENGLNNKHRL